MLKLIVIGCLILIFNIPFGYWRANVKRFSLQWYLSIHIPVPFVILLRIFSEVGFGWETYAILVLAFFLGQKLGSMIYKFLNAYINVSSCLVVDVRKLIFK